MTNVKIQSHASLREEMKRVARGEKKASKDAKVMSFDSVEALLRLLTPQNRELLAAIRDKKPQSSDNCVFRSNWTLIPRQTGHLFHGKLITQTL